MNPDDHGSAYHLGSVLAYLNDTEAHENYRRYMIDRYGETDNGTTAERTSKICVLLPMGDLEDLTIVSRLADLGG